MCSYQCLQLPGGRWGISVDGRLLATIGDYDACQAILKQLKAKAIQRLGASKDLIPALRQWAASNEPDLLTWIHLSLIAGKLTTTQCQQLQKLEQRYRLSLKPLPPLPVELASQLAHPLAPPPEHANQLQRSPRAWRTQRSEVESDETPMAAVPKVRSC